MRVAKLTYCWAKGLREARPINVGDKAERRTFFGWVRLRGGKLTYC